MKNRFTLLTIFMLVSITIFCQDFRPTNQSNYNLDFNLYLSGVKYAYLAMSDHDANTISDNPTGGNAQAILGILDYLKEIGFTDVRWGTFANTPQSLSSLCDLVVVYPSWNYENSTFTNIKLTFISCNQDIFEFVSKKNIWVTGYTDIKSAFYKKCLKMYGYKKKNSSYDRLKLPSEITSWTEQKLKSHFQQNGADQIEGIYESAVGTTSMPKYNLGVVKSENGYTLIYLSGATNYEDWNEGEVKAELMATATSSLFKAYWKMGNKKETLLSD